MYHAYKKISWMIMALFGFLMLSAEVSAVDLREAARDGSFFRNAMGSMGGDDQVRQAGEALIDQIDNIHRLGLRTQNLQGAGILPSTLKEDPSDGSLIGSVIFAGKRLGYVRITKDNIKFGEKPEDL